jgi:hypothetical protein
MQDSEELPASARELEPAVGQRPKHKRRGRVVTVLALGGVVALVTKEDLRSRLLDAVFGPEEQFEYDSVTEPVAPGIEPEGAAMFPQSAPEVLTAEAGAQDDALWSFPASHAEAGAPVSIADYAPPASDEEPSAAAEPTAPVGDDAPAPSDHTPVSAYDPPARADDTPAPAEDAPASAYDAPAPAYDAPGRTYDTTAPTDDTPSPTYATPAPADDTPAPTDDTPAPADETAATAYDTPAPVDDTPDPIETAKTPASGTPEPPHEAPAFTYPVYEAPPVASEPPTPNPVFDTPAPASEKGATAAYEAPAHGTPPRETPADQTPADQSPPAECRPAAETNTEPVASAEPSASAPELDSDAQPTSSDGSPSFSSSDSAAGAGFELTAEAPPGGPLERPTVPVFESIPAPSDVAAQPASEAEGEEPALGDAAPRRSGWWLAWRRDAAPEPPRWDWRND